MTKRNGNSATLLLEELATAVGGEERVMNQIWAGKEGSALHFYRKERQGSQMKSTYVGRGEIV